MKLHIKNKYGVVPHNVLNNPGLTMKAKGLYGYIQSKPQGWKFTLAGISSQCKDGATAIRAGLKELEVYGVLQRSQIRTESGTFENVYNLYEAPHIENLHAAPHIGFPHADNTVTVKPACIVRKNISKKEEVKKTHTDDGFDAFWAIYPSKKGKKVAMQKWQRLTDENKEAIMEDIPRRVQFDDHWIRGYVPNPATYINQERWNDDITQPKVMSTAKSFAVIA